MTLNDFINECKQHSKTSYVLDNIDSFDKSLKKILHDKGVTGNDATLGKKIIDTGVNLFAYLADAIASKGEDAIPYWNAVILGYPEMPHTDLYTSFYDVSRTKLLWYNILDKLETPTVEIKVEIIFNIIFRWAIASTELMRRMLVFCDYCRTQSLNDFQIKKHINYLHGTGDPLKALKNSAPSGRGNIVSQFVEKSVRHALAHGNVCIALPNLVVLRISDDEKESFQQQEYRITENPEDIPRLQNDILGSSENCYQSIRVFFLIYAKLNTKYSSVLNKYRPETINETLLSEMTSIIQNDPDGLKYWQSKK